MKDSRRVCQHYASSQDEPVCRLLVAWSFEKRVLVEDVPGLAERCANKTLAALLEADFQRSLFTADLLPADLTGTPIFFSKAASFSFWRGPLFNHLVLAGAIDSAPTKVQSARLEAMG